MPLEIDAQGPFELTYNEIDKNVTNNSIGLFALGFTSGWTFIVRYVGRSDKDLKADLKDRVGEYPEFKFCYANLVRKESTGQHTISYDFGMAKNLIDIAFADKPIL